MPNHVMNHIHFDCDERTAQEILSFIQKDDDGENEKFGPGTIDFNKLIPMPPEYLNDDRWYDWRIKNWGTKWNAYDEGSDGVSTISFLTAWSPPHEIMEALTERFTGVYFTHRWADEDIGSNVGQREYLNGECVGVIEPDSQEECIDIACAVWGGEPMDYGYVPNQAGTGYCQVDADDYEVIELLDRRMLFTDNRLSRDEIPIGLYAYDLRHTDDGEHFGALEPKVIVNHGGTVLTDEPIDFGDKGFIELTEDTEPNFLGFTRTMGEFLRDEWEEEQTETEGMKLE